MMTEQLMRHILPPKVEENETPLYLYVIINAEKYKNLCVKLESEWKFKHASLFEDEDLAVSMNDVAPYLVLIPPHHPYIEKIFKHYGHGGTLFFWSEEGFGKMLERMRDFFVIYSSDGSKGYFTFYRPSMFAEIFRESSLMSDHYSRGIKTYFCEDEYDISKLHIFSFNENQIYKDKINLKEQV